MSYHIYTTEGIVLSGRSWHESDRIYNILTRELGLIKIRALGVRKGMSKLRGALEPCVISSISLVRGREYWRVISAQSLYSIPMSIYIARPFALIEKLIQGEIPHPELFDMVAQTVQNREIDNEIFEVRLVSNILYHLGYMEKSDLDLNKKAMIEAINKGIQASHLV